MPEKTTVIRDVSARQTARGDIFDITDQENQKFSTFERPVADHARQLVGQTVRLRFTEKNVQKNGQWFKNLYYEGAESTFAPQGPPPSYPPAQQAQAAQPQFESPPKQFGNITPQLPDDRDLKIVRQSSLKAAVHTLGYLPDSERTPRAALEIAEFYLRYVYDGITTTTAMAPAEDIPF